MKLICFTLLSAMTLATTAGAQVITDPEPPPAQPQAPPPAPRPFGQIRFGALSLTPILLVRDLGIDNNVFDTVDDRKSDFTVTPTAGGELRFEGERLRAAVASSAGFVYYQRYSAERGVNTDTDASAEFAFSRRLRVFGSALYSDTSARLNAEIDARARRFITGFGGGATLGLTRRTEMTVMANQNEMDVADDAEFLGVRLSDTLSSTIGTKSLRLRYTATPLTTLGLVVSDIKNRFPNFHAKDENATDVRLEASLKPRALISGDATLGIRSTRPLSTRTPPYRGLVGDVLVQKRMGESMNVGLAFERGTGTSFDPAMPYFVAHRIGLSVRKHLIRRVEAWVSADRHIRSYRRFTDSSTDPGSESAMRYTAVISTQVTRNARLSWHMDYTDRASDRSAARAYDGFRSGLIVSYGIFTIGNRSERGGFGPW